MAKRKSKKKHSRRRRVGALAFNASSPLVKYGSVAAGYMLGDKINDAISSATGGKVDQKIVAGAQAALGIFLMTKKGKKNLALTVAAGVLAGSGGKALLQSFGVISGYQGVPVLNGYQDVPVIGKYDVPRPMLGAYNVPQNIVGSMAGVGNIGDEDGLFHRD